MWIYYYEDIISDAIQPPNLPSVFLAGPTLRKEPEHIGITPWREKTIQLFLKNDFNGSLIIPEFSQKNDFQQFEFNPYGPDFDPPMKQSTFNILQWETTGIEDSTLVLFWMPFSKEYPGFTTRAEVSRELQRAPHRIILGMPDDASPSTGHIRYHAFQHQIPIYKTLEETVLATLKELARVEDDT